MVPAARGFAVLENLSRFVFLIPRFTTVFENVCDGSFHAQHPVFPGLREGRLGCGRRPPGAEGAPRRSPFAWLRMCASRTCMDTCGYRGVLSISNLKEAAKEGDIRMKASSSIFRGALTAIFGVSLCLHAPPALAESPSSCDPDAFKDFSHGTYSDEETLSLLSLVDRTNFNSLKDNFGGNITIPIGGVPIPFGADFSTFSTTLQTEKTEHRFSTTKRESRDYIAYKFSDAGVGAYKECLRKQSGLDIQIIEPTERSFSLAVDLHDPSNHPEPVDITITREDGSRPQTWRVLVDPSGGGVRSFQRNPQVGIRIDANLIENSGAVRKHATVTIPPTPRVAAAINPPPDRQASSWLVPEAGGYLQTAHPVQITLASEANSCTTVSLVMHDPYASIALAAPFSTQLVIMPETWISTNATCRVRIFMKPENFLTSWIVGGPTGWPHPPVHARITMQPDRTGCNGINITHAGATESILFGQELEVYPDDTLTTEPTSCKVWINAHKV